MNVNKRSLVASGENWPAVRIRHCHKLTLLLYLPPWLTASRLAAALKAVDKLLAPTDEVPGSSAAEALKLKQQLLKQLGWAHWLEYERGWARVKFPLKLPPL